MLTAPRWSRLAEVWGEADREELTMIWHNLDGITFSEGYLAVLPNVRPSQCTRTQSLA